MKNRGLTPAASPCNHTGRERPIAYSLINWFWPVISAAISSAYSGVTCITRKEIKQCSKSSKHQSDQSTSYLSCERRSLNRRLRNLHKARDPLSSDNVHRPRKCGQSALSLTCTSTSASASATSTTSSMLFCLPSSTDSETPHQELSPVLCIVGIRLKKLLQLGVRPRELLHLPQGVLPSPLHKRRERSWNHKRSQA